MLVAVNFHYVRPSFESAYPSIHGLTPSQFEAQLGVLARAGEFVSAVQVRAALRGDKLPERAILVTFDDGLREQVEHAVPVLRRLGVPAMFFVNTAPIELHRVETVHKIHLLRATVAPGDFLAMLERHSRKRGIEFGREVPAERALAQYPYDTPETARLKYLLNAVLTLEQRDALAEACFAEVFPGREPAMSRALYMDEAQVRALDGSVGSHSHGHVPLGLIPGDVAARDIARSHELLTQWLGRPPFALSYPYGSREICTRSVGEVAARAGFEFAFTMERGANRDFRHPQHLARIDCNDAPGGKNCRFGPERLFDELPSPSWMNN
jgi:peptidoglycan/xylan/chitin deacetylase (PgdA/CDA1 family)